jgi:hypothetical protein
METWNLTEFPLLEKQINFIKPSRLKFTFSLKLSLGGCHLHTTWFRKSEVSIPKFANSSIVNPKNISTLVNRMMANMKFGALNCCYEIAGRMSWSASQFQFLL